VLVCAAAFAVTLRALISSASWLSVHTVQQTQLQALVHERTEWSSISVTVAAEEDLALVESVEAAEAAAQANNDVNIVPP
jgi:hypothetical protein